MDYPLKNKSHNNFFFFYNSHNNLFERLLTCLSACFCGCLASRIGFFFFFFKIFLGKLHIHPIGFEHTNSSPSFGRV